MKKMGRRDNRKLARRRTARQQQPQFAPKGSKDVRTIEGVGQKLTYDDVRDMMLNDNEAEKFAPAARYIGMLDGIKLLERQERLEALLDFQRNLKALESQLARILDPTNSRKERREWMESTIAYFRERFAHLDLQPLADPSLYINDWDEGDGILEFHEVCGRICWIEVDLHEGHDVPDDYVREQYRRLVEVFHHTLPSTNPITHAEALALLKEVEELLNA